MTRFRSLVAGAVVAGALASGAAFAQGPAAGPGGRGGRGFGGPAGPELPLRALNLTETQQQQVREIRERSRAEGQQAARRLRSAVEAQRTAIQTMPVNEGLIRSTSQELAEAQTDVAIQQAHAFSQVWTVLTDAQREQVKKLRAERENGTQRRGQNRRRG